MYARRIRILAISVLVLSVCSASRISAQDACSVKEQRRVDTVTGKFLLQETAVSLTLPKFLHPLDPVAVRLEVSGSSEAGAVLRFASEIAPLRDGATLQATLRLNERFIFSVQQATAENCVRGSPPLSSNGRRIVARKILCTGRKAIYELRTNRFYSPSLMRSAEMRPSSGLAVYPRLC